MVVGAGDSDILDAMSLFGGVVVGTCFLYSGVGRKPWSVAERTFIVLLPPFLYIGGIVFHTNINA
jgi:hypothetical protein